MKISEFALRDLLPLSLTNTPCVSVQKQSNVQEAIGLLIPYLESMTDSLIVTNGDNKPLGIVGGREIIERILSNPTYNLFENSVESVMSTQITSVSGTTKLQRCYRGVEADG
ncbi:CBS domain-containing protein [Candidatus Nitrosotenuis chungbukensis]|uniref:CBS domain-containing protein n=1 Tax=Candidatus Nitrosotenuis chungbukensis TaxID=1353246 RepID=UPI00267260B6|nr:CBS domain-containing protein [Candidatus Nitrosotenuis chungbukensis]WKT58691.1 CBS domain-containing protein [Candidatus Nitrosotenuis chungbukensis]